MSTFTDRVIDFFETIHPLDRVERAGWLLRGVPYPESVAAHSHFMSLMALFVVDAYPDRFDRDRVLAMALIHDVAEARLMDVPMPYADAYLKDAKAQAEQTVCEELFAGLPGAYAALHAELVDAQTPEARLVRGLDKAQMMVKALMYERDGCAGLDEFWTNPRNFADYGIEPVSQLFDAICERAGRARPAD
jgi:putative hydrolase of HD superfamily